MEARSEVGVLLGDVTLNSPQMIVVGKAVEMNENLDSVALVNETGRKVLPGQLLIGFQLYSGSLESMEFGVEERF